MAYFRGTRLGWHFIGLKLLDDVPAVLVSLASAGRAVEPGVCGSGCCPYPGVLAPAHDGAFVAAAFGSWRATFDDAPPMVEVVGDDGSGEGLTVGNELTRGRDRPA